ncbi:hypothetical protein [Halobaculum rubrum]|uniref:hypothetical protein n=1 Tax=Halobaculum rubrum TaxID=2872158 RepID=UPI001CA44E6B|nr:hypothetical protein [Halobaculum rubrum]QZX98384.1 hypothetical protein K6T25_08760 [Halobaculum rubrum]
MSSPTAPAEGGAGPGEVADGAGDDGGRLAGALYWVRAGAYTLASLLALSLLMVGTVAVIAEVKGTWHWAIHLESTISYMGILMGGLLALLVPLLLVSLTARVVYDV